MKKDIWKGSLLVLLSPLALPFVVLLSAVLGLLAGYLLIYNRKFNPASKGREE